MRSSRAIIVPAIWAVAGLAVGGCAALLWSHGFKAGWVEATGTWFGAVATVLTLLWAVQVFRADQANRERARLDAAAAAAYELEAVDERIEAEAALVTISLKGGAGHGTAPDMLMTSVNVEIRNDTTHQVTVISFGLLPPLNAKSFPAFLPIAPMSTKSQIVEIQHIPAQPSELSGRPVDRYDAEMTYQLAGRTWLRKVSGDSLERIK
jgi:hypothetical protein